MYRNKLKCIEINCKTIKIPNNPLKAHSPLQLERGRG